MTKLRSPRRARRGMTLVEAVISVLILTIGIAAIFQLLARVSGANQSLQLSANGLDLYSQLAAEIRDAQCDFAATNPPGPLRIDPGIGAVPANTWIPDVGGPPPPGSRIATFGNSRVDLGLEISPAVQLSYRVRPVVVPRSAVAASAIQGYEVDIRVRQITADPAKDGNPNRVDGYWIKVFTVEKLCNGRVDPMTASQSGRGEFAP